MIKRIEISDELLMKYGSIIKKYKKDDYLARKDTSPRSIIYIYSGVVKIVNFNEAGDELLHGFNSPNEIIGIGTYIGEYKYYNDFIAVEDVETREIPLDQFELMISENFEITRNIIKYLSDILEIKTLTLSAVLGKTPRSKVIFALNRIKSHLLKEGDDMIPFTRQEMANFLGIRVETIIRTIKELEEEGILRIEKGKVYY